MDWISVLFFLSVLGYGIGLMPLCQSCRRERPCSAGHVPCCLWPIMG